MNILIVYVLIALVKEWLNVLYFFWSWGYIDIDIEIDIGIDIDI